MGLPHVKGETTPIVFAAAPVAISTSLEERKFARSTTLSTAFSAAGVQTPATQFMLFVGLEEICTDA